MHHHHTHPTCCASLPPPTTTTQYIHPSSDASTKECWRMTDDVHTNRMRQEATFFSYLLYKKKQSLTVCKYIYWYEDGGNGNGDDNIPVIATIMRMISVISLVSCWCIMVMKSWIRLRGARNEDDEEMLRDKREEIPNRFLNRSCCQMFST